MLLLLSAGGCIHLKPNATGAVRPVDLGRASAHTAFESVSTPTEADPVFRYKLSRYSLKSVGYEEEIEPQPRMTTAGWIAAGTTWALALGAGTYFAAEGKRKADSNLRTWGAATLFAGDGILAAAIGFRLFGHGRKLKPRWKYIEDSDRRVVEQVTPVTAAGVELRLKGKQGEQKVPLATDMEGVVEIPIRDLEPYLSAQGLTPAKLVYPANEKTYTTFSIRQGPTSGPTVALIKPNEQFVQTDDEVIELAGIVRDPAGLKALMVAVNRKKRLVWKPKSRQREHTFSTAAKLEPGLNVVRIRAYGLGGSVEKLVHVERATAPPQVFGVFIGISKYASLPAVGFASEDARALRDLFVGKGWVGSANAFLFTDEEATLEKVRETLGIDLKERASPNDTVLVYFAGHGATERDAAAPDGDGFSKYLAVHDTRPGSLYSTAFPIEELRTLFERIRAGNVLFILDTCYSGGGGRTISKVATRLSDKFLRRLAGTKGRAVMSSAGPLEVAREDPKLKHGIYTAALIEALGGKADANEDGLLDVAEIHGWVYSYVQEKTDGRQNPTLKGKVDLSLRLEG